MNSERNDLAVLAHANPIADLDHLDADEVVLVVREIESRWATETASGQWILLTEPRCSGCGP